MMGRNSSSRPSRPPSSGRGAQARMPGWLVRSFGCVCVCVWACVASRVVGWGGAAFFILSLHIFYGDGKNRYNIPQYPSENPSENTAPPSPFWPPLLSDPPHLKILCTDTPASQPSPFRVPLKGGCAIAIPRVPSLDGNLSFLAFMPFRTGDPSGWLDGRLLRREVRAGPGRVGRPAGAHEMSLPARVCSRVAQAAHRAAVPCHATPTPTPRPPNM